jgi:3-oxoacyl-[acyl-carrier protein] reductase
VAPGYIDAPLPSLLDELTRQALIQLYPIGRLGLGEETANAVLFLPRGESSFVTGSNLVAHGGFAAGKS